MEEPVGQLEHEEVAPSQEDVDGEEVEAVEEEAGHVEAQDGEVEDPGAEEGAEARMD